MSGISVNLSNHIYDFSIIKMQLHKAMQL